MTHRVLLIGLGSIGMGYDLDNPDPNCIYSHAKAFDIHDSFELVGGVDPNPTACMRFQDNYGTWAGTSLQSGLEAANPDVVIIASPTDYHSSILETTLKYSDPKAVLCEKPLSYSLAESQAMVANASHAGCSLYVNYLRRVEPGVNEIKRRIDCQKISSPLKGVLWYSKGLLHNGSHFSNLLEYWLGPVEDFKLLNSGRSLGKDDCEPDVLVSFHHGEVTFLAVRHEDFSHHEINLVGPNGCLRYEHGGSKILWQPVSQDPNFPDYTVLSQSGEIIFTDVSRLQWHVADQLSACLRGESSSLCTGAEAIRTLEALTEIRSSL